MAALANRCVLFALCVLCPVLVFCARAHAGSHAVRGSQCVLWSAHTARVHVHPVLHVYPAHATLVMGWCCFVLNAGGPWF